MTHWASHGFVVAAVDHPGLKLGDLLAFSFDQDLTADLNTLYAALENLEGDWAFLEGLSTFSVWALQVIVPAAAQLVPFQIVHRF